MDNTRVTTERFLRSRTAGVGRPRNRVECAGHTTGLTNGRGRGRVRCGAGRLAAAARSRMRSPNRARLNPTPNTTTRLSTHPTGCYLRSGTGRGRVSSVPLPHACTHTHTHTHTYAHTHTHTLIYTHPYTHARARPLMRARTPTGAWELLRIVGDPRCAAHGDLIRAHRFVCAVRRCVAASTAKDRARRERHGMRQHVHRERKRRQWARAEAILFRSAQRGDCGYSGASIRSVWRNVARDSPHGSPQHAVALRAQ